MDILDILLANSLTPQANLQNSIASIQESLSQVNQAVENANSAAEIATRAAESTSFETFNEDTDEAITSTLVINLNDETYSISNKNYKTLGDNEDGSMTQKAIKQYLNTNLGENNNGSVVVVGENGQIEPSSINESSLIHTQILTGTYQAIDAVGVEIDYDNRNFTRIQDARGLSAGQDFDKYPMYGGMNRCLVDDNGQIIAFYGDNAYIDNFSTGYQTMVYIPKFYYMRVPITLNKDTIKKEVIMISAIPQNGFKIHPAFINDDGEEVDYFLYPAYEGSTFDVSANAYNRIDSIIDFSEDKLSSITNAKPISGYKNELNTISAEQLAQNRGQNWHITSIQAISAIQMLMLIEFCSLNGQDAIGKGICNIESILGYNCSSYTGSTYELGNQTGSAQSTTNERNGTEYIYSDDGRRAISYRGIENPWGNIWSLVGNLEIRGNSQNKGGIPFIKVNNEYKSLQFTLPNSSNWISGFGYVSSEFDWAFIPSAADNANSAVPVGDYVWVSTDLDGTNTAVVGGHWGFKENDGMFYYGFDKSNQYSDKSYSARVMFVPTKNEIYNQNIILWGRKS